MDIPVVSIVTPAFNAGHFIDRAIESVLSQTFPSWEMLIVDDVSSDNTISVANRYSELDQRIIVIKLEKNQGASASRNIGVQRARGRYIAFLDADDEWMPDKLMVQVNAMLGSGAAMCCTRYCLIDECGRSMGVDVRVPRIINYNTLLKLNVIGCSTVLIDTGIIPKEIIHFPDPRGNIIKGFWRWFCDHLGHEDFQCWLYIHRWLRANDRIKQAPTIGVDLPLASYRVHQNGVSSNKLKGALWVWLILTRVEKLGLIKSLGYFSNYVFKNIAKNLKIRKSRGVLSD
jgi:teichuronic acid biosynthesis glycosyltransferase TuaG